MRFFYFYIMQDKKDPATSADFRQRLLVHLQLRHYRGRRLPHDPPVPLDLPGLAPLVGAPSKDQRVFGDLGERRRAAASIVVGGSHGLTKGRHRRRHRIRR